MEYERRRTGLAITAPPDLQGAAATATREVRSSNDRYELCADPVRVKQAIEQARQAKERMKRGRSCITCGPNTPLSSGWSTVSSRCLAAIVRQ